MNPRPIALVLALAALAALMTVIKINVEARPTETYIVRIAPTYDRSIPRDQLTYGDLAHLISENDELVCSCGHELYLELYVNGAGQIAGGIFYCPACKGI